MSDPSEYYLMKWNDPDIPDWEHKNGGNDKPGKRNYFSYVLGTRKVYFYATCTPTTDPIVAS